mmetsp:Transcript_22867/g.47426  ORF Transcript_22867/g.47426 Transcript_22867/m.47426 type:complete len:637 (-) Transcript_22867:14-1924(-)
MSAVLSFSTSQRVGVRCQKRIFPKEKLRNAALGIGARSFTRRSDPLCASVYVALGSNIEPRFPSLQRAAEMLTTLPTTSLEETSFLYETKPMYVEDQPSFLNAAVKLETDLQPQDLLQHLKRIEEEVGREDSFRNGPRLIDLDILLYDDLSLDSNPTDSSTLPLTIPHPRIDEREFVLRPLNDINAPYASERLKRLDTNEAIQVLPLPNNRTLALNSTLIMGILNVTPDSFSDGGNYNSSVEAAVSQAQKMVDEGASIIDVGGESTRPNATPVTVEEELKRTLDIISALRSSLPSHVAISIDTRRAETARRAVESGADIVNDVSAGQFDPEMMSTVSSLKVPYILMHSRGTPETMADLAVYGNVVDDVCRELSSKSRIAAEEHNIYRWSQVLDVGIGFAKTFDHNVALLKAGGKTLSPKLNSVPILWGASRKGFIGKILSNPPPSERDYGTVGAHLAAIGVEGPKAQILRVHNVKGAKDASDVFDTVRGAPLPPPFTSPPAPSRKNSKVTPDPTARKPTKVCDPYDQGGKPLAPSEAARLKATIHADWTLNEDATVLRREFAVGDDYNRGSGLLKTLSNVADNNNHYPKLMLERRLKRKSWETVVVCELHTQVLGGLSYKDFELGMHIDVEIEKKS